MSPKPSQRLVIDASVARACGGSDAIYPTSKHCRDFLQAVVDICHQLVMSPEIRAEWDMHQSRWARKWRVSMVARRKLCVVAPPSDQNLRDGLARGRHATRDVDEMLKDVHLLEAALATDRCIVSLDEAARALFTSMSGTVGSLRSIAWVNPDQLDEAPIAWLQKGARTERQRLLGGEATESG